MKKCILSSVCAVALSVYSAHGTLIITEFLANPAATADAGFEYFEVFNNGSTTINVGDLTISDDDTDSVSFSGSLLTIAPGAFFVFGENAADSDIDWNSFTGNFTIANAADEIVISDSLGEISRLAYTDGDSPGDGIALVLNDTANALNGVTQESDYIAEIAANDTLSTGDIGSPGSAGSTIITLVSVPEPSAILLFTFAGSLLVFKRRRVGV